MSTVPIDDAKMLEIVGRLVEAVNPDRIILFGSRARGDAGPDRDLDLLIVKDSDVPRHRRTIPAYNALRGLGIPTDIIWRTPGEIVEWSQVPNHFLTRAIREAKCSMKEPLDLSNALIKRPTMIFERPRSASRMKRPLIRSLSVFINVQKYSSRLF